ncbi:MAG TPA: UDP-N-acetylglucosamine 2-epimerase (non-hydrolyzing) [Telluria sp.]|nr:UDP-N-acetylglucosamine 2-epimerase (non-hydrolyzing) [Telluria sp.]
MNSLPEAYRIVCVVGARPNLMKMAPLMSALRAHGRTFDPLLVHTGQHFDMAMSGQHFEALGLPEAAINLGVGGGSHASQTADVLRRFEPVLDAHRPAAVLVVGDVNSTLACALAAAKRGTPVMHVEAGLRSGDRTMPEEINRILTDQLSELLFASEPSGVENLLREGIARHRIRFRGNVMIDSLQNHVLAAPPAADVIGAYGGDGVAENPRGYALLTLHRPANVDDAGMLRDLLETVAELAARLPLIFPVHPRTMEMVRRHALEYLLRHPALFPLPPLGYLEMLGLMKDARLVLTDSGGIQEETTALGVPCLTLRDSTERPVTVEAGTNTVVGRERTAILAAADGILLHGGKSGRIPPLWDGKAAERIAADILDWLRKERP